MALSPRETQIATELADVLYDFLPGKAHPYGNQDLSFPAAVQAAYLSTPWPGGGKGPALRRLFSIALDRERHRFCTLISEIVSRAMVYRGTKAPLTREEIERVNALVFDLGFKIPGLHDPAFLSALPRKAAPAPAPSDGARGRGGPPDPQRIATLVRDLTALAAMAPVPRGTAFERFLKDLFDAFHLAPREAFRLRGEQIDGSFRLGEDVYLVEARWQSERTGGRDLAAFDGQVGARAAWSRGLFVSYAGFTEDGLDRFMVGRPTRIICMDAADLYFALSGAVDLRDVLREKVRRAVEDARAFVPVVDLFPHARRS